MNSHVTVENVCLGMRVQRNPLHWRGKWKDDGGAGCVGTVIGFVDGFGVLNGCDSGRIYKTDKIGERLTPNWAVVWWSATGRSSTYPIGSSIHLGKWWGERGRCFSLLIDRAVVDKPSVRRHK